MRKMITICRHVTKKRRKDTKQILYLDWDKFYERLLYKINNIKKFLKGVTDTGNIKKWTGYLL